MFQGKSKTMSMHFFGGGGGRSGVLWYCAIREWKVFVNGRRESGITEFSIAGKTKKRLFLRWLLFL